MDPSAFGDAGGLPAAGCGGTGGSPENCGGAQRRRCQGVCPYRHSQGAGAETDSGRHHSRHQHGLLCGGDVCHGAQCRGGGAHHLGHRLEQGVSGQGGPRRAVVAQEAAERAVPAAHRHRGEWRHHPAAGRFLPGPIHGQPAAGGHLQPAGAGEFR